VTAVGSTHLLARASHSRFDDLDRLAEILLDHQHGEIALVLEFHDLAIMRLTRIGTSPTDLVTASPIDPSAVPLYDFIPYVSIRNEL